MPAPAPVTRARVVRLQCVEAFELEAAEQPHADQGSGECLQGVGRWGWLGAGWLGAVTQVWSAGGGVESDMGLGLALMSEMLRSSDGLGGTARSDLA